MTLTQIRCAHCGCKNIESYRTYTIRDGGEDIESIFVPHVTVLFPKPGTHLLPS